MGFDDPKIGHRYGAEHLDEVLGWCAEVGIRHVTAFVTSVDNVRKRASDEVDHLMGMIEEGVRERLARPAHAGRFMWPGAWTSCPTRLGGR
jgi:short-chain Z-isoprenyl diphosphate synthase